MVDAYIDVYTRLAAALAQTRGRAERDEGRAAPASTTSRTDRSSRSSPTRTTSRWRAEACRHGLRPSAGARVSVCCATRGELGQRRAGAAIRPRARHSARRASVSCATRRAFSASPMSCCSTSRTACCPGPAHRRLEAGHPTHGAPAAPRRDRHLRRRRPVWASRSRGDLRANHGGREGARRTRTGAGRRHVAERADASRRATRREDARQGRARAPAAEQDPRHCGCRCVRRCCGAADARHRCRPVRRPGSSRRSNVTARSFKTMPWLALFRARCQAPAGNRALSSRPARRRPATPSSSASAPTSHAAEPARSAALPVLRHPLHVGRKRGAGRPRRAGPLWRARLRVLCLPCRRRNSRDDRGRPHARRHAPDGGGPG